MHTESQIRKAIRPLVEMYGSLTTSEVKKKIGEVLEFDDEDKIQSNTRNEMMIIQRVGNIVAHQIDAVKVYSEGFIVDKNYKPALFSAISGLSGNEKTISDTEIEKRKKVSQKVNLKERKYTKINWELENERRTLIGTSGEQFVYEREVEFVKSFDSGSADKVIHLSASQGDGFGYDVISINEKGETIFIEVKTTKGPAETPFYMSINEKTFFEENIDNNAYIYRVYNFNIEQRHGSIFKISAKELFEFYEFDPITFMVCKK